MLPRIDKKSISISTVLDLRLQLLFLILKRDEGGVSSNERRRMSDFLLNTRLSPLNPCSFWILIRGIPCSRLGISLIGAQLVGLKLAETLQQSEPKFQ